MILLGHPFIVCEPFLKIVCKEDIENTPSLGVVCFDYHDRDVSLCHYAASNEASFALFVRDEREVILASALGASFIVCEKGLVVQAQKFADDYLFDAKILLYSEKEEDIVYAAKHSVDGILFKEGVKDGSN